MPIDRRHVERRRQVVDDRVEQRLHALVLERRCRRAPGRASCASVALRMRRADLGLGDRLALEVLLHQRLVGVGDRLEQLLAVLGGLRRAARRESRPRDSRAPRLSSSQTIAFIVDQIDDAAEARPRRRSAAGAAPGSRRGGRASSARPRSKSAPTRSILLTKAMRGTLYLSAWRQTVSDCGSTPPTAAEDRDGAVEHAQRALHLDGEVDVAGRVDDVDAVVAARSRWSRRR